MATQQTADEHRAGQAALVSLIPALLLQAWPLLALHDLKTTMPAFMAAVRAVVARYGQASAAGALDYYRAERAAAKVTGRPTLKLAPTPADSVIESAVGWATADLYGPVTPEAETQALQRLDGAVSQLVIDQGRDTLIEAVRQDSAAKGWVRITKPGACSFCTMLALRGGAGMLYTSRQSGSFQAHDHCRCSVAPVFTSFEPSAHMREMQALWVESTKGLGGADARNAFRRAMAAKTRTQ